MHIYMYIYTSQPVVKASSSELHDKHRGLEVALLLLVQYTYVYMYMYIYILKREFNQVYNIKLCVDASNFETRVYVYIYICLHMNAR